MADIGRLLLLPPPNGTGRAVAARSGDGRESAAASDDRRIAARVEEAADSTSGGRAKQFRFRVVDGGRSDSLAGNAEVPARFDPNAETIGEQEAAARKSAGNAAGANRSAGGGIPLGTPLATFLAQLIAQEQLPAGLYDPPVKAADRAYRQAGGEPALTDSARSNPRYQIAV